MVVQRALRKHRLHKYRSRLTTLSRWVPRSPNRMFLKLRRQRQSKPFWVASHSKRRSEGWIRPRRSSSTTHSHRGLRRSLRIPDPYLNLMLQSSFRAYHRRRLREGLLLPARTRRYGLVPLSAQLRHHRGLRLRKRSGRRRLPHRQKMSHTRSPLHPHVTRRLA